MFDRFSGKLFSMEKDFLNNNNNNNNNELTFLRQSVVKMTLEAEFIDFRWTFDGISIDAP